MKKTTAPCAMCWVDTGKDRDPKVKYPMCPPCWDKNATVPTFDPNWR